MKSATWGLLFATQPNFLLLAPALCPFACPQAAGTKEGQLIPHGRSLRTSIGSRPGELEGGLGPPCPGFPALPLPAP